MAINPIFNTKYDDSDALDAWQKLLDTYAVGGTKNSDSRSTAFVAPKSVTSKYTGGAPAAMGSTAIGSSELLDKAQTRERNLDAVFGATNKMQAEVDKGFLPTFLDYASRPLNAVRGSVSGGIHQIATAAENMGINNPLDEWTADPRYAEFNQGDDNKFGTNRGLAGNVDDFWGRALAGWRGEETFASDNFAQSPLAPSKHDRWFGTVGKTVLGLGIDTGLDPLTYATFGAGAAGKAALFSGIRAGVKNSAEKITEVGVKELAGSSESYKLAVSAFDKGETAITREKLLNKGIDATEATDDELKTILNSVDTQKAFAGDELADRMIGQYYTKSARGMRQYVDEQVKKGIMSKADADAMLNSLDPATKGGIRLAIPFTKTSSPTPLSGSTIGGFLGRDGAGAVSRAAEKGFDTLSDARLLLSRSAPISKLRRSFSGTDGIAWDKWVKGQAKGLDPNYSELAAGKKGLQLKEGELIRATEQTKIQLNSILSVLSKAPKPEVSMKAFHDAVNSGIDNVTDVTDPAAAIALESLRNAYKTYERQLTDAGFDIEFIKDNFSHRATTKEWVDYKQKANPSTSSVKGAAPKSDMLKSREAFMKRSSISNDGTINFESMSIADANALSMEKYGVKIYEDDALNAFARYAQHANNSLANARLINHLKQNGILVDAGIDTVLSQVDPQAVSTAVTKAKGMLDSLTHRVPEANKQQKLISKVGDGLGNDDFTPLPGDDREIWVQAIDKRPDGITWNNNGTIVAYTGNGMYDVKFVPKGEGKEYLVSIHKDDLKLLDSNVPTHISTEPVLDRDLISILVNNGLIDSKVFGLEIASKTGKKLKKQLKVDSDATKFDAAKFLDTLPEDGAARQQVVDDLMTTITEVYGRYGSAVRKSADTIREKVDALSAADIPVKEFAKTLRISAKGLDNDELTAKILAKADWLDREAARVSKSGDELKLHNVMNSRTESTKTAAFLEENGYERLAVSDALADVGDSMYASAMYKDFLDSYFKNRELGDMADIIMNDVLRPYMTIFKTTATIGRGPGYHIRNGISAAWNNMVVGVTHKNYADSAKLWKGIFLAHQKVLKNAEKYKSYEEAEAAYYGYLRSSFGDDADRLIAAERNLKETGLYYNTRVVDETTSQEMGNTVMGRGRGGSWKSQLGTGPNWLTNLVPHTDAFVGITDRELNVVERGINRFLNNPVYKASSNVAQNMEQYYRAATYFRGLDRFGNDADAANNLVKMTQFDYSDLSPLERDWVKAVIPFYTFSRHNVPFAFRTLMNDPRYIITADKIMDSVQDLIGAEGEDGAYLNGLLPNNVTDRMGFATKFRNGDNTYAFSHDLPFNDLQKWMPTSLTPDAFEETLRTQVAGSMAPWLKAPAELLTGADTFTGQPVGDDEGDMPAANWARLFPGLTRENSKGETVMNATIGNTLAELAPPLGQVNQLIPFGQSEKQADKNLSAYASTLFGLPLTTLTPDSTAAALSAKNDADKEDFLSFNAEFEQKYGISAQDIIDLRIENEEYLARYLAILAEQKAAADAAAQ